LNNFVQARYNLESDWVYSLEAAGVAKSIVHIAQVVPKLIQTSEILPAFTILLSYGQA
jgi:hypothetical protein